MCVVPCVLACQSVSIETSLCTASIFEPFIAFTFSETLAVSRSLGGVCTYNNICAQWLAGYAANIGFGHLLLVLDCRSLHTQPKVYGSKANHKTLSVS